MGMERISWWANLFQHVDIFTAKQNYLYSLFHLKLNYLTFKLLINTCLGLFSNKGTKQNVCASVGHGVIAGKVLNIYIYQKNHIELDFHLYSLNTFSYFPLHKVDLQMVQKENSSWNQLENKLKQRMPKGKGNNRNSTRISIAAKYCAKYTFCTGSFSPYNKLTWWYNKTYSQWWWICPTDLIRWLYS